ncbi:MAG: preprotein translocase subunit SecE [Acidimicrobiales bacterium]
MNREARRSAGKEPVSFDVPGSRVADDVTDFAPKEREREHRALPEEHRAGPRQFLHEVNVELRKVVWPTRAEVINYSTVVFLTLAIMMALIFGLDIGFSKIAVFLFK